MDISFLTKDDIEAIRKTTDYLVDGIVICPGTFREGWTCYNCRRLFPKSKREFHCPCSVYTKKHVIKRARYFVKLWEDEHA